jgi:hypothetical protein
MLTARFHNLPRKAPSNFDCLRNTAPFRHQPRNVRTCPEIAPSLGGSPTARLRERLDSHTDGDFLNLCNMFLRLYCRLSNLRRIRPPCDVVKGRQLLTVTQGPGSTLLARPRNVSMARFSLSSLQACSPAFSAISMRRSLS